MTKTKQTASFEEQLVARGRLQTYLSERLPGDGEVIVERHVAGHSNETFFVRRGEQEWVLRRPPLAVYLPTAHDVLREFRVLDALKDTNVRVPRVSLACEDPEVIGAPFYLMEKVSGSVLRFEIPDPIHNTKDHALICEQLVTALVELHSVDPVDVGLDGFGKPTGYLARQIKRWTGQLELATSITTQAREVPEMWELKGWLEEHLPESGDPVIVHGDYKLDNVMFSVAPPATLVAILDWEMSTIGDPLSDLGWMISFWRESDDPPDPLRDGLPQITTEKGFLPRTQLVEMYQELSGRKVRDLTWYVVAAVWKLACLLEGSFGRHLMGTTDDPFFAALEQGVPGLANRGLDLARGGWKL